MQAATVRTEKITREGKSFQIGLYMQQERHDVIW